MLKLAALPSFLNYMRERSRSVEASILSICKHHMPRWETNGVFFALNQTVQSTEEVRTNSMENNIQHRYKYCLDMWAIVLEMLF